MYVSRSFETAVSYLIDLFEVTNLSLPSLTQELNKAHLDNVTKVAIYKYHRPFYPTYNVPAAASRQAHHKLSLQSSILVPT